MRAYPRCQRSFLLSSLPIYVSSGFLTRPFGRDTGGVRRLQVVSDGPNTACFRSVFLACTKRSPSMSTAAWHCAGIREAHEYHVRVIGPLESTALYITTIIHRTRATRQVDSSRISLQKGLVNALAVPEKTRRNYAGNPNNRKSPLPIGLHASCPFSRPYSLCLLSSVVPRPSSSVPSWQNPFHFISVLQSFKFLFFLLDIGIRLP